jgi:phosphoribosylformylglycinamidine cyclo-ligase
MLVTLFTNIMSRNSSSYSKSGVVYEIMDPVKKLSQEKAKETSNNLKYSGFKEVLESRGETAYVWDQGEYYMASVLECLGSKNLVADETRKITGKTYYEAIAQDTVAAAVNDIVSVGAQPLVINAYFSLGDSNFLKDEQRTKDLIEGWANACNLSGATWGGGETPTIRGVTYPETINLAASAVGIIKPKERLILGEKISDGNSILLIESSGIHANGVTLARQIAEKLEEGYGTKMDNGELYGEALLKPTHLYAKLISALFDEGVDIHYIVNITGHGFRKLMRADKDLKYIIEEAPPSSPLFEFIQNKSGISDEEMYGTFNMGAGLAIYLNDDQIEKAQEIAAKHNLKSWKAGRVESGDKQVIIKPLNITFTSESLGVR